jgi:hypothetical protein
VRGSVALCAGLAMCSCATSENLGSNEVSDGGSEVADVAPQGTTADGGTCGESGTPCCPGDNPCHSASLICKNDVCTSRAPLPPASSCGYVDEPCCQGTYACDPRESLDCKEGTCRLSGDFMNCGGGGQACCKHGGADAGSCNSVGLVCAQGTCAIASDGGACGEATLPCCSGNICDPMANVVCKSGTCVSMDAGTCGGAAEPCCAGDVCNTGLRCTGGSCS